MNQDDDGDDEVEKQKILWVEQYLGTCVLKLYTDVFQLSSAKQQREITKIHVLRERKSRHKLFLSFHLEFNTNHVGYAKFEL